MHPYSLLAAAKINLYLEIIGDRPDGYHELIMVMQSLDLCDRIELRPNGIQMFRLTCQHSDVPTDASNLALKAAQLMASAFPDRFSQYGAVDINIQKNIPVGAGLAGGSANAAAVLVGLDLMWKLGLTQSELQELGAKLGSDVPFCIEGGTVLVTGRGEHLSVLPAVKLNVVLAKYRSLSVSTAWAYQTYRKQFGHTYLKDSADLEARRQRVHSGPMIQAIAHQNIAEVAQQLHNDLEKIVLPAHPQVQALRDTFAKLGAIGTMMSGSGPTVFALAESADHAEHLKQQMRDHFPDPDLELWVTQSLPQGILVSHP
jgi:4-diphosphocytidyl-2-C-methyl-D-erythritol kinase